MLFRCTENRSDLLLANRNQYLDCARLMCNDVAVYRNRVRGWIMGFGQKCYYFDFQTRATRQISDIICRDVTVM